MRRGVRAGCDGCYWERIRRGFCQHGAGRGDGDIERIERPLSTIPNTVTVISSVELEQQLAIHNDISTVLGNLIPSFSPSRQKMTNAGESLRGRKLLYIIDGIPQSSPLREGGRDGHIIDSAVLASLS